MSTGIAKTLPNYSQLRGILKTYIESDAINSQLTAMHQNRNPDKVVYIAQDDLYDFIASLQESNSPLLNSGNMTFTAPLILEWYTTNPEGFTEVLSDCIDEHLSALASSSEVDVLSYVEGDETVISSLRHQIHSFEMNARLDPNLAADHSVGLPKVYLRPYSVRLLPSKKAKVLKMREIKANSIGKLVRCRGIVSSASPVRLMIDSACYTCAKCKSNNYIAVHSREFMPPKQCMNSGCSAEGVSQLLENPRDSKFVMYQELKLQELSSDTPPGSVPRAITLHLYGPQIRTVSAGDICTVTGIYKPISHGHQQTLKLGHNVETAIEVQKIVIDKVEDSSSDADEIAQQAEALIDSALSGNSDLLESLSKSLAPEIYGHENVKKALVLLLVGAPSKKMKDVKMRGNINLLLCGDPGVAKSQLLKYITHFAPRAIYTSGKGSSAAGLTATVVRDPSTGELILEGGALVLADKGICLLDEFDKLPDEDKTALHEIMEQEKVSVAKAGIVSSLNARCSIIAAANPVEGKYNKRKTMTQNINLPAALLSRFDLVFILCDNVNASFDRELARHITNVHMTNTAPVSNDTIPAKVSRAIIERLRASNDDLIITPEIQEKLVDVYLSLRNNDSRDPNDDTYTSARSLMTIIRLSMASAKVRMSPTVDEIDVNRAVSLIAAARASIQEDNDEGAVVEYVVESTVTDNEGNRMTRRSIQRARRNTRTDENIDATVFQAISDVLGTRDPAWNIDILYNAISHTGADRDTFDRIINEYWELGIFVKDDDTVFLESRADEL